VQQSIQNFLNPYNHTQKIITIKQSAMKKFLLLVLLIPCLSTTLVYSIYEALKITQDDAKNCLLLSIGAGGVMRGDHIDLVSNAKSLTTEEKVKGILELMRLAKEYTSSDEFKNDYKKWRNEKLNPNTKSKLGVPKFGKMLENKINNKVDKAENEKKYPSDPNELIKKRLTDFLAISATVDFDAEVSSGRFVNSEYEKKTPEWKMCYRAGKEVVEAARVEAQKWLNEVK
jgi:hypothetical protein